MEAQEFFDQYKLLIFLVAVWEIIWKGQALWRASKLDSRGWFVALLIINSVGLLPILYLYVFSKSRK